MIRYMGTFPALTEYGSEGPPRSRLQDGCRQSSENVDQRARLARRAAVGVIMGVFNMTPSTRE